MRQILFTRRRFHHARELNRQHVFNQFFHFRKVVNAFASRSIGRLKRFKIWVSIIYNLIRDSVASRKQKPKLYAKHKIRDHSRRATVTIAERMYPV